jgi:hypothetical protein
MVSKRSVGIRAPTLTAWIILAVLDTRSTLSAAEFSAQIADGLNRPVADVQFVVSCEKSRSLRFASDQNGMVHGTYDSKSCTPPLVSLDKEGYGSFSSGLRSRYVLRRRFEPREVAGLVNLEGGNQQTQLRELLAGDFSTNEGHFRNSIFHLESRLRPLLLELLREPEVTERARELLSVIGEPHDLDLIMRLPPPPASLPFPERWRYSLATALINPDNEEEWSFLRKCALNEFSDRWVDAGAIQTLKLNASSQGQQILEEAKQKNLFRASTIAHALEYIASTPTQLSDVNLEALAKRVALVIGSNTWQANSTPLFNETNDKALVDFTFQTSEDRLVYTATFHKTGETWSLRGVRETSQAFAPALVPIVRPKQ